MVFSWPHLTEPHFCRLSLVMAVMKFCPGSRGGEQTPLLDKKSVTTLQERVGWDTWCQPSLEIVACHNHTASKMGRVSVWTQLSLQPTCKACACKQWQYAAERVKMPQALSLGYRVQHIRKTLTYRVSRRGKPRCWDAQKQRHDLTKTWGDLAWRR